ncbi:hypothetical protein EPUL_004437 [Erysiphe pulchra]|uniref:C2H2-type domain-containing protein n=1 Tax=Erysiphe pulchra TaxID=225359 RepID=A0A2S4PWN8_9PEZI|nr:hypothetical protein EPUL_004437 [Erysiphe pulchra]
MSTPNEKYFSLLSTSSLEHIPNQAIRSDFARNFGNLREKASRWNSETLRIFHSPTCTEQNHPTISSQENNSFNSIMNPTRLLFLQEGHQSNGFADSSISPYRHPNEKFSDSFPIASTRFQVHDKFQALSRPYDKEMLSKLDFKRNNNHKLSPSKHTGPFLHTSSTLDTSPGFHFRHGLHIPFENLSLPGISSKKMPSSNSLSHWTESVDFPSSYEQKIDFSGPRLPVDINDADRSYLPPFPSHLTNRIQGNLDDYNSSHRFRNSHVKRMHFEPELEKSRKERKSTQLSLDEKSCHNEPHPFIFTAGKRTRASSSAEDENTHLYAVKSPNKFFRRRESVASRNSTDSCFHSHRGSISSIHSDTKNDSYPSTISSITNNRISVGSFDRLSPDRISPKSADGINSPHATSQSSNQRRQGSSFRPIFQHKLSYDNRVQEKINHLPFESAIYSQQSKNLNLSESTGVFICECCPKKPKKFDNKEDLEAHEQEKQYECAYCRNRFKNKNEAERHQNSLHLRRHSWSCTALSGYAAAFYNSSIRPGEADTCGFCGEDFPRSRTDSGIFIITKHDWDNRINHLTEIHKFGECNHDKKFFRADHFRQHLKHSHAGTSGKWTNMLENACMRDEPVQKPVGSPENINSAGSRISSCDTVSAVEL